MAQAPTQTQQNLHNKLKGIIVGVCLGDALGMNVEFRNTEPKQEYNGLVPDKPWSVIFRYQQKHVEASSVSDDTEMTIVLLNSILDEKDYEADTVLREYLRWANDGSPMMGKNTRALMKGVTTTKGFHKRRERLIQEGLDMSKTQSNGSLMRASPLCLFSVINTTDTGTNAAINTDCSFTNDNPVNRQSSLIFVSSLRLLIRGEDVSNLKKYLSNIIESRNYEKDVKDAIYQAMSKQGRDVSGKNKGWVCHALYMAFYCVLWFDNIEKAMDWCIGGHPGSDTDTNASIACALLGAKLGYNKMQEESKTQENIRRIQKYFATTTRKYVIRDFDVLVEKMCGMYPV